MPPATVELHLRFVSLGGTATCDVCSRLLAWKFPFEGIDERIEQLRCPHCRGSVHVDEKSLVPELEITAGGRKETVLASLEEDQRS